MCILFLKNFKSLLTSIAVLFILMTSLTPCFGEEYYSQKVYENYCKDLLDQIVESYTPEKWYCTKPEPQADCVAFATFKILKDGSITDRSVDYEEVSPSFSNRLSYKKSNAIAYSHSQYIKYKLLDNIKANPFPENFADCIEVYLVFSCRKEKSENQIFHNNIKITCDLKPKKVNNKIYLNIYIERNNDTPLYLKYPR